MRNLICQHLNPEIITEIEAQTKLGKHLNEILTIIPDGVRFQDYCEKTWTTYLNKKDNDKGMV